MGSLGASWAHLVRAVGASWSATVRLGAILGRFGAILDRLGRIWEGFGGVLMAFWEPFRKILRYFAQTSENSKKHSKTHGFSLIFAV